MGDKILDFVHTPAGKSLVAALGLSAPPQLRRAKSGFEAQPLAGKTVLVGSSRAGAQSEAVLAALEQAGAACRVASDLAGLAGVKESARVAGVDLTSSSIEVGEIDNAYVLDLSGMQSHKELRLLYDFFQPRLRRMAPNTRIVLIGLPAGAASDYAAATAQSALPGFVRSLAKECGKNGSTVNLLQVAPGAEATVDGALRFFLSSHSAFITGQVLPLAGAPEGYTAVPAEQSLKGKVAVVTGAARGIGAAIAQVLAREGATVIGVDRPAEEAALAETISALNGVVLPLDITDPSAPETLAHLVTQRFGGVDIIVHNAGITRDKMLRNMAPHLWDMVLDVNLGAIVRTNERLMQGAFKPNARIVCISSIGGIGGNAGQTNYAATKSAIIGYCNALSGVLAKQGMAINAIAPGFIETQMTAAIPVVNREVGRRLSTLSQGGLPVDIAEAVTFMASPLARGVNGATLRVCGQSFIGA
ncbi:MAG: 3-oxoacyl-ACP reductase [Burkholderiales bacterium]|jgi:3-oxoacyl-[acyl-carrier protein] reductase|nr:3-oxoacyl-ACP reductase [Burkholderiales bacterium]